MFFHLYRGRRDESRDGYFYICMEAAVTVIVWQLWLHLHRDRRDESQDGYFYICIEAVVAVIVW